VVHSSFKSLGILDPEAFILALLEALGDYGTLLMPSLSYGILYLWLVEFPLRQGEVWAWWVLVISGLSGFGSFLAYLGYGYLDTWHGLATLLLLPIYLIGLIQTFRQLPEPRSIRSLLKPAVPLTLNSRAGLGQIGLLVVSLGMIAAGLTILTIGAYGCLRRVRHRDDSRRLDHSDHWGNRCVCSSRPGFHASPTK
jgi:hypothetical protein